MDSARGRGLSDIAFTDHDRYLAGVDFNELNRLSQRNPDVKIRAGIELDNDPATSAAGRNWIEQNWDELISFSAPFITSTIQHRCSTPSRTARNN